MKNIVKRLLKKKNKNMSEYKLQKLREGGENWAKRLSSTPQKQWILMEAVLGC